MHTSHPRRQELNAELDAALALGLFTIAFSAVMGGAGASLPAPLLAAPCPAGVFALLRLRKAKASAAGAQVGRKSEQTVARRLKELANEGWTVRHSVTWCGRGDIDHVAISPTGTIFIIETKTRTYGPAHLDRTRAAARAVDRHRRGAAAQPVL